MGDPGTTSSPVGPSRSVAIIKRNGLTSHALWKHVSNAVQAGDLELTRQNLLVAFAAEGLNSYLHNGRWIDRFPTYSIVSGAFQCHFVSVDPYLTLFLVLHSDQALLWLLPNEESNIAAKKRNRQLQLEAWWWFARCFGVELLTCSASGPRPDATVCL